MAELARSACPDVIVAVRSRGVLPVDTFFELAAQQYYAGQNPFGAAGDFVTAPEISQLFGEIVGLACASCWQQAGCPVPVRFVEAGPGRGTLMADMLRAGKVLPGWLDSASFHLIETSPSLRKIQYDNLTNLRMQTGEWKFCWHDSFADVPDGPVVLVANEFLDALPVRQLVLTDSGWKTRCVAVDKNNPERLVFTTGEAATKNELARIKTALAHGSEPLETGAVFEYAPARENYVAGICQRIGRFGGVAIFIDYGYSKTAFGDSLQAVAGHGFVPVTENAGTVDITSHVDFMALANAAHGKNVDVFGPLEQGEWLKRLGIEARAMALLQKAGVAQAYEITSGITRLTAPHAMGSLFKVMVYAQAGSFIPAGFTLTEKYNTK